MGTLQKAKELAVSIATSQELRELLESEEQVKNDKKASILVDEYFKLDSLAFEARMQRKTEEEIQQAKEKFEQKKKEVNEYSVTKHYFDSQKKYDELRQKATELIEQSPELKMLEDKEKLVYQDERGEELLSGYRKIKRDLVMAEIMDKPEEEIQQIRQQLEQNLKEINEYDITRDFFEEKDRYNELIDDIDDIIKREVKDERLSCSNKLWFLKKM